MVLIEAKEAELEGAKASHWDQGKNQEDSSFKQGFPD